MNRTWIVRLQDNGEYAGTLYDIHEIQFVDLALRPRVHLLRDGLIAGILNPRLIQRYELQQC